MERADYHHLLFWSFTVFLAVVECIDHQSPPIRSPGMMPAINRSLTEAPEADPYMMNGILGRYDNSQSLLPQLPEQW